MRKLIAYGVWGLIGAAFLGWELSGWRTLNKGKRDHVTLSELVWKMEAKAPATKYVVLAVMVDLALHFFFKTRLWLV